LRGGSGRRAGGDGCSINATAPAFVTDCSRGRTEPNRGSRDGGSRWQPGATPSAPAIHAGSGGAIVTRWAPRKRSRGLVVASSLPADVRLPGSSCGKCRLLRTRPAGIEQGPLTDHRFAARHARRAERVTFSFRRVPRFARPVQRVLRVTRGSPAPSPYVGGSERRITYRSSVTYVTSDSGESAPVAGYRPWDDLHSGMRPVVVDERRSHVDATGRSRDVQRLPCPSRW